MDHNVVTMKLARSQMSESSQKWSVVTKDFVSRSGTRLLKRHLIAFRLGSGRRPFVTVFPAGLKFSVIDWSKARSIAQLSRLLASAMTARAICHTHWFGSQAVRRLFFESRRPTVSNLLFRAKVFYPIINLKRFGCWKSDAAIISYRDEDAVAQAATEGSASLLDTKVRKHRTPVLSPETMSGGWVFLYLLLLGISMASRLERFLLIQLSFSRMMTLFNLILVM